jgi:hypothetical protein
MIMPFYQIQTHTTQYLLSNCSMSTENGMSISSAHTRLMIDAHVGLHVSNPSTSGLTRSKTHESLQKTENATQTWQASLTAIKGT